tara:strand:- start:4118 stop:4324 length:207 start_codon:yes stop_codon:yes gene_type:complete
MRITNEILQDYKDSYKVSISMRAELNNISQKIYGDKGGLIYFCNLYPSEQKVVVATYLKSIQQCISVK